MENKFIEDTLGQEIFYCPNCDSILNEQIGFDPESGVWTCTKCGELLMDENLYEGESFEGVIWYCDKCNDILNKQPGFSDSYGSWICDKCHFRNIISDEMIR